MNSNIPLIFTVFGATGNLAEKKIFPALLALAHNKKLPQDWTIVAFSRRPWTDEDFRDHLRPSLLLLPDYTPEDISEFLEHVEYTEGHLTDPGGYEKLKQKIELMVTEQGDKDVQTIFHLAIQPEFYKAACNSLGTMGLISRSSQDAKIIIEKPFGHDTHSAQELEQELQKYITEEQIHRIDHYIGKGGFQNVLRERKENKVLEQTLNRDHVERIEIKMLEKIDIEGRGDFYNSIGALRDVGQNHVLEMLAVAIMDLPVQESDENIDSARAAVLQHLAPITSENIKEKVIRAQYDGYHKEEEVPAGSETETYFKINTEVMNARWQGVPIILEGGKALPEKVSEIRFVFKDKTEKIFNIETSTGIKRDAYEVLLEEAIKGEQRYFVSIDEIIASWMFITPIIENISAIPLHIYKKGNYPDINN